VDAVADVDAVMMLLLVAVGRSVDGGLDVGVTLLRDAAADEDGVMLLLMWLLLLM